MPKRLLVTLVAGGSMLFATAAPAGAQTGSIDPLCQSGGSALVPLRVDLGPLARVSVRVLCVDEA